MCFLVRHVSDLPLKEISTCVREIGAAAAASSPLPSFFFLQAFGWHGHWAAAGFGRRQAPAEKPNRSITVAAESAAGGREIFIRAEKRQQGACFGLIPLAPCDVLLPPSHLAELPSSSLIMETIIARQSSHRFRHAFHSTSHVARVWFLGGLVFVASQWRYPPRPQKNNFKSPPFWSLTW